MCQPHEPAKGRLAGRSGLTLLEVIVALGIFLTGSVGIIALFVTASVLHVDATNQRQASFIADELLSEVRHTHFRDVFATTTLTSDINDTTASIPAYRLSPDAANWGASFDRYPLNQTLRTTPSGASVPPSRNTGAILIEGEWIWYGGFAVSQRFVGCVRGLNGSSAPHEAGTRVLQPRSWYYVLESDLDGAPQELGDDSDDDDDDAQGPAPDVTSISVFGNPASMPTTPEQGFIAIDNEWIRYRSRSWDGNSGRGQFHWEDSREDRGFGLTRSVPHTAGAPVTVARQHPGYPDSYYTVQFYPANTTGAEACVIVSVGYGTDGRFRVCTFRSIYAPTKF